LAFYSAGGKVMKGIIRLVALVAVLACYSGCLCMVVAAQDTTGHMPASTAAQSPPEGAREIYSLGTRLLGAVTRAEFLIIALIILLLARSTLRTALKQGIAEGFAKAIDVDEILRAVGKTGTEGSAAEHRLQEALEKPQSGPEGNRPVRPGYWAAEPLADIEAIDREVAKLVSDGKLGEAEEACRSAMESAKSDNERAVIHLLLSKVAAARRNHKLVIYHLDEAKRLAPRNPRVHYEASTYYRYIPTKVDLAMAEAEDAVALDKEQNKEPNPVYLHELGVFYWEKYAIDHRRANLDKAIELAEEAFSRISAATPRAKGYIPNNLAYYLAETGTKKNLERALTIAATLNRENVFCMDTIAYITIRAGEAGLELTADQKREAVDLMTMAVEEQSTPLRVSHLLKAVKMLKA
jgi:tetratricopeptide (TPR) repeat protein